MTYRRCRASHEYQAAHVCRTLVAQCAGGIEKSADAIRLDGGAEERATPRSGSSGSFLRLEEFLLRVSSLGLTVGVAKDGAKDCEGDGVVKESAKGDG